MKKKISKYLFLPLFILLMSIVLISCKTTAYEEEKPIVAVTIVPEATFVEAVAGDLVDIVTLVPPGYSPENFEPTAFLMEKFSKASVYFSIGVPTEEANILPNVGDVLVVSLNTEVAKVYEERTFSSGERDPHIWLSPKRVKVMIDVIASNLTSIDPANAATYAANAVTYKGELDQLDADITAALSGLSQKSFICYHPAFGYLADDYGLTMYALEEEGKEATAQHLQDMIDFAKENGIKVIFYQAEIDSSQSAAFAEEIGGVTSMLEPLSADYINNLESMAQTMASAIE